jgi:hypothetical protein
VIGYKRHGIVTIACAMTGTLAMLALAYLLRIKVNFLDFVALPITLGIGVDYAVNVTARAREEGPGSARLVVATTGAAVLLCSFTTTVGYGSLLLSANRGIRSFGLTAILGELAQIWLEQPGVERGIAVTFPDAFDPPGTFFGPLVRGIAAAPWVRKTTATALSQSFPSPGPGQLAPALSPTFPPEYVETIKQTRHRISIYRSMLVDESDEPDRLETLLLLAESGQFLGDQATGSWFARYARDSVGAVFNAIRPDTDQVITLTSSASTGIPMRVTNGNDEPVRVTIRLAAPPARGTRRTAPAASMLVK